MAERITFPIEEIERRCNNWKEIVWSASTNDWHLEGESMFNNLDGADADYIEHIMDKHPKLRRLMPDIIYETITFGDNEFIR